MDNENTENIENMDEFEDDMDDLADMMAECKPHYAVNVLADGAIDLAGMGDEENRWSDDHDVTMLGTDKAECRYLVRRIMNLWHMEDPSVHKAHVTISSLFSNWYVETEFDLFENEL